MKTGDLIVLNTPDNLRLHGPPASVGDCFPWGAHVIAPAAATGRFRALWSEMVPPEPVQAIAVPVPSAGTAYTGDSCETCGSLKMRRAGACLVCDSCGSSSGCS